MITKELLIKSFLLLIGISAGSMMSFGQSFGLERDLPKRIVLPDAVYRILLKDDDVRNAIEKAKDSYSTDRALKKQFFQATEINLNDDNRPDLLVKAQSYLAGSNITRYWIFERTVKGYSPVLKVGAFGLSLLKRRSNEHRSIKIYGISGSQTFITYYRFDKNDYVESWSKTENR